MVAQKPCTDDIAQAVSVLDEAVAVAAGGISQRHKLTAPEARKLIMAGLHARSKDVSAFEADGRAASWRCRFRIYAAENMDEPVADSDPDLQADMSGTSIIKGLPAVGTELSLLAIAFHGTAELAGLGHERITQSLRGLRPTLSRRGGNATWRIQYDTLETFKTTTTKRGWLARVDVERVAR